MASSTSSFSAADRLQANQWHRLFLWGLLLFVAVLIIFEVSWRILGLSPQIENDYDLWKDSLVEALETDSKAVVLVGASRVMQGIHIATLISALPPGYRAYHLGNSAASPLPALSLLANHTQFSGTVLIDVTPRILFGKLSKGERNNRATMNRWVRTFVHEVNTARVVEQPLYKRWERELQIWMQRNLLIAGRQVTGGVLLRTLRTRSLPEPRFWCFLRDRTQIVDYSLIDLAAYRQDKIRGTADTEVFALTEYAKMREELGTDIETLRRRGAKVLFVRMPSEGRLREIEAEKFPREAYWDDLLSHTNAVGIHFEDHGALQGYKCSDASHVDSELAPQFTLAFADILRDHLID